MGENEKERERGEDILKIIDTSKQEEYVPLATDLYASALERLEIAAQKEASEPWEKFTASLPKDLYAYLVTRAESDGVDVGTKVSYLLAYGLDHAPRHGGAALEPLTDPERSEVLWVKMRAGLE